MRFSRSDLVLCGGVAILGVAACGPDRAPGVELGDAAGAAGAAGALPALGGILTGGGTPLGGGGGEAGGEVGGGGQVPVGPGGGAGAPATGGAVTGAAGAGGGAGEAGAPAVCGNGVIEAGEDCDGAEVGDADCATVGFEEGELACADCTFDPSGCSGTERCYDGRDNDGDGDADCADADDCADACASSCGAPPELADPDTVKGDTTGHANRLDASCGAGAGLSGPEVVYRFVAGATGVLEARASSSAAELVVSLTDGCDQGVTELACAWGSVAAAPVTVGDVIHVVVDGLSATDAGPYTLEIATRATECGDGVLDVGEECDDAGNEAGDGCAPDCAVESSEQPQNDAPNQPDPLASPYFGRIDPSGDEDWIAVEVPAGGGTVVATTRGFLPGDCASGDLDPYLELYDETGATLLADDDDTIDLCAVLESPPLDEGTVLLRVTAATENTPTFPYVLEVSVE